MENTKAQELKQEYLFKFYNNVQTLVQKRKNLGINQNKIAVLTGKSLATIQNFENYRSLDYFLIFSYKYILKT